MSKIASVSSRSVAVVVALQLAAASAFAEEPAVVPPEPARVVSQPAPEPSEPRIGIGIDAVQLLGGAMVMGLVALEPRIGRNAAPTAVTVYVPINVLPRLRLEPAVTHKSASSSRASSGGGSSSSEALSMRLTSPSLGIFYRVAPAGSVGFYAGPRLGLSFASSHHESSHTSAAISQSSSTDTTATNWSAAAAVGAEYFIAPRFSVGADVEAGYVVAGTPTTVSTQTPAPPPGAGGESTSEASGTFTQATVRIRLYL